MILAVTGGRAGRPSPDSLERLKTILAGGEVSEMRGGGATGIDTEVFLWMLRNPIATVRLTSYPITSGDWRRLGRRAGPARNLRMLTEPTRAHLLLAWPGGAGTADCVRQARELGIEVRFMEKEEPAGTGQAGEG